MYNSFDIKTIWTNDISDEHIEFFLDVQRKVLDSTYNRLKFKKKYLNNIYGPSLIILAFGKDKCVGARAFWRNDLNDKRAYQPCDTAVLSECRGCGVFSKMTLQGLEVIGNDAIIYNFPNDNSYQGYIKLGWMLEDIKRYKIVTLFNDDLKRLPFIENDYCSWLIGEISEETNNSIFYIRKKRKYFLIKRRKWNLFSLIGEIDKKWISHVKKASFPILLVYSRGGYFGRGIYTVVKNHKSDINIPVYKVDTLF